VKDKKWVTNSQPEGSIWWWEYDFQKREMGMWI
jgi:hypothetical protein